MDQSDANILTMDQSDARRERSRVPSDVRTMPCMAWGGPLLYAIYGSWRCSNTVGRSRYATREYLTELLGGCGQPFSRV
eukprot:5673147-Pyramimonas_sp.AAC.1